MNFYDIFLLILCTKLPKPENSARSLSSLNNSLSTHEKGNNRRPLRKMCKQYSTKDRRKDMSYYCKTRPEKPSLCLTTCQYRQKQIINFFFI